VFENKMVSEIPATKQFEVGGQNRTLHHEKCTQFAWYCYDRETQEAVTSWACGFWETSIGKNEKEMDK
jgi:hypothetical protein